MKMKNDRPPSCVRRPLLAEDMLPVTRETAGNEHLEPGPPVCPPPPPPPARRSARPPLACR
jgi:hypothetical protein